MRSSTASPVSEAGAGGWGEQGGLGSTLGTTQHPGEHPGAGRGRVCLPAGCSSPCCPRAPDASVPFAINTTTGIITVSGWLDREQLSSEEMLLEVLVSGGQRGEPPPLPRLSTA